MSKQTTQEKKARIKRKIRSRISGTEARPRLSVYRSNAFIYAQLVDDQNGKTIAAASDLKMKKMKKVDAAKAVGKEIAAKALAKGITAVSFDRNGFKYTGRVKTLADEARAAGLIF